MRLLRFERKYATCHQHFGPFSAVCAYIPPGRLRTITCPLQQRIDSDAGIATLDRATITVRPDLRHAVVTSRDNTAVGWDIANGQRRALLEGHPPPAGCLPWRWCAIITAASDGTARLWETASGQLLRTRDHSQFIVDAALNADGSVAVTGVALSPDGTRCGLGPVRLAGHAQGVNDLVFSPDGALVATAADDGTVWIGDATSGSPLMGLPSRTAPVRRVTFSPDGRQALTAAEDGTIKVYPIRSADLLPVAACRVGRSLSNEEFNATDGCHHHCANPGDGSR